MQCVHVDTTLLDPKQEFQLSIVQPPNAYNPNETKRHKLQPEQSSQDMKVTSPLYDLATCYKISQTHMHNDRYQNKFKGKSSCLSWESVSFSFLPNIHMVDVVPSDGFVVGNVCIRD